MTGRRFILSFFGAGLSKIAPGTVGSAAACAVIAMLTFLRPSYEIWQVVLLGGVLLASIGCVLLSPGAIRESNSHDPQFIVLDEVAGICLTAAFQPIEVTLSRPVVWIAMAFAAFRVFDVLKPSPARNLEKLPQGWGILCDDLAAAVYANLVCQLILRWV